MSELARDVDNVGSLDDEQAGAVGLIALRSRAEGSADVPWGWPEAMVLLIAVPVVVAGLWILARRFDGRS
jgi:hypothetical protein